MRHVQLGTAISTDKWRPYKQLGRFGYRHSIINHSRDEWMRGDTHTNIIDGFWSQLKRSIRGTHVHVSRRHLAKYLGEFEFRWNSRHASETMFARLLMSF